ncbi:MAG: YhcH/YjgK/YiaL family protein [Spirochaetes bacterium]|nr:YhcH/YjgK/YiaL family protein [Spirochaetota bacterium]
MIIDHIDNYKKYNLGKAWEDAFEYFKNFNTNSEPKRYDISGDDIFLLLVSYYSKPEQEAKLESHMKYIDIQIGLEGREIIKWQNAYKLKPNTVYNKENDIIFYDNPDIIFNSTILHSGIFAVFFPQDAHIPGIMVNDKPEPVKKAVIKIKLDLIDI